MEVQAPSPERITTLELILTASCNLACGYCYQNAKQKKSMDVATLERALDLILGSREPRITILFIGGEALLELPLLRHGVEYVEARRERGRSVDYQISTNGLLLDAETARFLAKNRFRTQLSHDGVPAAQAVRGEGTHARLDALLERLRREEPYFFRYRFVVQNTVTGATVPYIADSFAYHLEKGVERIRISACDTFDPTWSNDLVPELDRQFARVFELSLAHYRRTGKVPFEPFRRERRAARRLLGRSMCGIGSGKTVTVDVDGSISGCVTFVESYQKFTSRFLRERLESIRLGRLDDGTLPRRLAMYPGAVDATELFDRKEEKYSSFGRCGECRHLADCFICPVSIGHIPGNQDPRRVPDFPCAFNLATMRNRERFPAQGSVRDALRRKKARPLAGFAAAVRA